MLHFHDAVLKAAAFCIDNPRVDNTYADGPAAIVPEDPAVFERHSRSAAIQGYVY